MNLAFREDVIGTNGDVKFPAGVFFDWPKATFQRIAENIGKLLEDITVTPDEAGAALAASTKSGGKAKGLKARKVKPSTRARL